MPYAAFLSYSHLDRTKVDEYSTLLRRAGLTTFQDHRDIVPGESFRAEIAAALSDCDAMVFFASRASLSSQECQIELEQALEKKIPVLPLLLEAPTLLRPLSRFAQIADAQWLDGFSDTNEGPLKLRGALRRRQQPSTPVICVSNLKGGVGKTTLTAYLASTMFRCKQMSILLIDLDPQANLSQFLLAEADLEDLRRQERSVVSMFEAGLSHSLPPASQIGNINLTNIAPGRVRSIPESFEDFSYKKLSIVAGQFETIKYTLKTHVQHIGIPASNFSVTLNEFRKDFDLILIDVSPSSSFILEAALRSATHILCPVWPGKFAALGVENLRRLARDGYNIAIDDRFMIVMNGVLREDVDEAERELRSTYSGQVLTGRIPFTDMLSARFDMQILHPEGLSQFFGRGRFGVDLRKRFESVADEVLDRVRVNVEPARN